MLDVRVIDFPVFTDARGTLIAVEAQRHVPFDIQRVFWIFDTAPSSPRGHHAHHVLKQVLICVQGRCQVFMTNGVEEAVIVLDSPSKGLLLDALVWHEIRNLTTDCILLALASDRYQESDYIRSYEEYAEVLQRDTVSGLESSEQPVYGTDS